MWRLTPTYFIQKAKLKHGDKYDYSKVTHVYAQEKLQIICPHHGIFHQRPSDHMRGQGCPKCANINRCTTGVTTLGNFIEKAKQIHGSKYSYAKVDYRNNLTKVIITCPTHGDFSQAPYEHIRKRGCPQCGGYSPKMSQEGFISKAKSKHGGRYSYEKVHYINSGTKVCITCSQHGDFFQDPSAHLSGNGCPVCVGRIVTKDRFIAKARSIHGDLYSYQKVVYVNSKTSVLIICSKHGDFRQAPTNHLGGNGCDKCARLQQADKKRFSLKDFLEKARKAHGTKYNYDKSDYIDSRIKTTITCPIHGDFKQRPQNHWMGSGCPRCAGKLIDTKTFVSRANKIHGDKYSYEKTVFKAMHDKVTITCRFHGDFQQSADHHLQGQGCKRCRMPRGESVIEAYLKENGIDYEWQYSPDGLATKRKLYYDFCIKINGHIGLIEYHGVQHYKPITFGGGASDHEGGLERDRVKTEYAKENKIPFLVISHESFDRINDLLSDFISKMRKV